MKLYKHPFTFNLILAEQLDQETYMLTTFFANSSIYTRKISADTFYRIYELCELPIEDIEI